MTERINLTIKDKVHIHRLYMRLAFFKIDR